VVDVSDPGDHPFVEVSDPGYGPGMDPTDSAGAVVDADVETDDWRPIVPAGSAVPSLAFIDGVQRIEAWLTVSHTGIPGIEAGLACAVGAGVVEAHAGGMARLRDLTIRRLVITSGATPLRVEPVGGFRWESRAGGGGETTALQRSVGALRQELEHTLAERYAAPDRLLVLDGRLTHLRDTRGPVVGAIKSHHRMYLPAERAGVVARLGIGERTPLFAIGDDRYSWYQRLPVADARGWAGVLRGEVARSHGCEGARRLADIATALLGRYAGRPHRDARAPQNLAPIAGLEARLRHRLGDQRLATRAVRRAAAGARLGGDAVAVGVREADDEAVLA
jgi:uncharacterized protein